MKTSTKWMASAVTAAAIFFGSNVMAQTNDGGGLRLGIGVEGGIPTGNAHDGSNIAIGGTARLQYDFNPGVSVMLTSGYYNFFGKNTTLNYTVPGGSGSITYKTQSLGMIPIKAGIKAFPTHNFYFSGEVGAGLETNGPKDTKLILAPGLGYAFNNGLDIGARYENYSGQSYNFGMAALRIAYGFKL